MLPGSSRSLADENLQWDAQARMQPSNHIERKAALPIQDFGNTVTRTDKCFQVLTFESLLLHPEQDGLDRVGLAYREVFLLVDLDQRCQDVQLIAFVRA